ncbi:hypothetical protein DFJ74DRAFT_738965 [Hyaloraphidium curvatum]|nr:hypothetical protein DFJ74DRAFT_738965 [Hyaloraphidium curvatum]
MSRLDEPVVVLGAGLSGLATAAVLLADGFTRVDVLEKHPHGPGGVWARGRGYPELRSNNPRGSYRFSDFPFEEEQYAGETFLRQEEVQAGLERFAEERAAVVQDYVRRPGDGIEPLGDLSGSPSPRWTITHEHGGEVKTKTCTFLAVCTGLHDEPLPPCVADRDKFAGTVVHSAELGDPAIASRVLESERVVIVGCSKSAIDVATLLASKSGPDRPVTVLSRSNHYLIPIDESNKGAAPVLRKAFVGLAPYWNSRNSWVHGTWMGSAAAAAMRKVVSGGLAAKAPPVLRPPPDLDLWSDPGAIVATEGFFQHVRDGSVRVVVDHAMRPEFVSRTSLSVSKGGETIDADCVIECIGYRPAFPDLFDPHVAEALGLPRKGRPYRLWRQLVSPGIGGIAFNGMVRNIMNSMTSEVGAHWISSFFQSLLPMPSVEQQNAEIDAVLDWQRGLYPTNRREDLLGCLHMLHFPEYLEELLGDMGCKVQRGGGFWTDLGTPQLPVLFKGLAEERMQSGTSAKRADRAS